MINDFKLARIKLISLYLFIIGCVVTLFSFLVVYQSNSSFTDPVVKSDAEIMTTRVEAIAQAQNLFPTSEVIATEYEIENGVLYLTTLFSDETEVKVDLLTGKEIIPFEKKGIIASLTSDFDEMVGWIALIVFFLAAFFCVMVANKTLAPISRNIHMQKQFVSDAAHELRNPLASLHALIESILHSGAEDFKRSVLNDLLAETKRLIRLSEGLLALEKGEYKKRTIVPQSLPRVVETVNRQLAYLIQSKEIKLQINLSTETLRIDQGDIETILYNLIHNALKFTPNNGVIKITWVKKQLSISDSGIGISKENIPHLFERFYKADLSRTNEGSGLGLTIVKEITDRYGAKITVSSNLGEGTTITVRFK